MTIIDKPQTKVIVFDDMPPEANAMILALYSRDPQPVETHRSKVAEIGSDKFMAQYYVGYGHKSIGDCGSTTICCENVSMLAAKAIQNNRLYNGQEASTRYLDMKNQPVLNPLGTEIGRKIQEGWMSLYARALEVLVPHLTEKYPRLPEEKEVVYAKAIKAKAFDIARAFLPAGCTTYVGWHTTLRQAWDHINDLLFHPLDEVREMAKTVLSDLQAKYPNSFGFKRYDEQDRYYEVSSAAQYRDPSPEPEFLVYSNNFDTSELRRDGALALLLRVRPQKTELPAIFEELGTIQFRFPLDFGSFRDLQRHRSCSQEMPLLTTRLGFNKWYLDSLPADFRKEALVAISKLRFDIEAIKDVYVRQYYVAMGFNVTCVLTTSLPSAVYIAELRSGQTVHPTLRPIAQEMGHALKRLIPYMTLHVDYSPDEWSTVRGKHDIVKKEE